MVLTRTLLALIKSAILWSVALGFPYPYPDPFPKPMPLPLPGPSAQMMTDPCCQPGPSCTNPCQDAMAYQQPMTYLQPAQQASCCMPGPSCDNPCQPGMAGYASPSFPTGFGGGFSAPAYGYGTVGYQGGYATGGDTSKIVYAPYPGEITFKLMQNWNPDTLLDHASPGYQILAGNVANAIRAALGPASIVNNIYFREGYVPGNPSTQPKVVVHCMVNGGSDAASLLAANVKPDGTLGDGLKVYKDSFNAY